MKKNAQGAAAATLATPHTLGYRMPAEWEPHAATWLAWPHEPTDWPGKFESVPWVFAEVARNLQDGERIRIIVSGKPEEQFAKGVLSKSGVSLKRVDFVQLATDRSWTRDFLPLGLVKGRGKGRETALVKWKFNGWARYKNHARDEQAGLAVALRLGAPLALPEAQFGRKRGRVVLEGGAIDVDGEGSLLATEECLLDGRQARNRALGKAGTEAVLRDHLGAERVLWLERGIAGDDTAGHIDDFARFVAPGKVVLAEEKNRSDPNFAVLKSAAARLARARDAKGRKLEVIRLPMPAPIVFDGQRLPASYANFYIGNSAVLVPTFNDPHDREALGIIAELFPSRRVVGIHSTDFVLGLGTIHCSTQQEVC
ncbi:MAG TPA: agmatine deiminase family protein [Polyangiaceae bacterium]|jgi:agmatine deiminase|nr:agmatine deiminase family protein [Polyangiaceae bacterium]